MTQGYQPLVLNSLGEICKNFGVGADTVRAWAQAGAPIAIEMDEHGAPLRYRCEVMRLYLWLETKNTAPRKTCQ